MCKDLLYAIKKYRLLQKLKNSIANEEVYEVIVDKLYQEFLGHKQKKYNMTEEEIRENFINMLDGKGLLIQPEKVKENTPIIN